MTFEEMAKRSIDNYEKEFNATLTDREKDLMTKSLRLGMNLVEKGNSRPAKYFQIDYYLYMYENDMQVLLCAPSPDSFFVDGMVHAEVVLSWKTPPTRMFKWNNDEQEWKQLSGEEFDTAKLQIPVIRSI